MRVTRTTDTKNGTVGIKVEDGSTWLVVDDYDVHCNLPLDRNQLVCLYEMIKDVLTIDVPEKI